MLLLVGLGLVVVAVAWWITSREAAWDEQTDGMLLAVVGAMIAAYGVTSWLLRARAVCAARRGVMFSVVPGIGDLDLPPAAQPVEHAAQVVAHPEQGRFHRPECALVAGSGWPTYPRAKVTDREPCGVCRP